MPSGTTTCERGAAAHGAPSPPRLRPARQRPARTVERTVRRARDGTPACNRPPDESVDACAPVVVEAPRGPCPNHCLQPPTRHRRRRRVAALDDLVELAAVEPHAAALRAVVDLDPLPLG